MILAKDVVVYLKTTGTCNLDCSHCFTSGSKGKKIFFNPASTANFLKNIFQEQNLNSMRILYHGGEPMLTPLKDLYDFHERMMKENLNINFGIQTNLVYRLNSAKRDFFKAVVGEGGIGTSWDPDIRFGSGPGGNAVNDLRTWEENVSTLTGEDGHSLTLMVCLSKTVVRNYSPLKIINYAIGLGFKYILFERLTNDGNATQQSEIFPENREIDEWIQKMYQQTLEHKLYEKIGNMFLDEIATSYLKRLHVSNRCRGCEQKLITINADGSLAGCPNSATADKWGNINQPPKMFLNSNLRIGAICKEKMRHPECLTCPVNDLCNGDCYKLGWDDTGCAAPKSLMKYLKSGESRAECEKLVLQ